MYESFSDPRYREINLEAIRRRSFIHLLGRVRRLSEPAYRVQSHEFSYSIKRKYATMLAAMPEALKQLRVDMPDHRIEWRTEEEKTTVTYHVTVTRK